MATFYGIGVGVGSPKAVTMAAVEVLQRLDILYVPKAKKESGSVAHNIVKEYLKEDLEIKDRHFPMNYDTAELEAAWTSIAGEIEADVRAGKEVGFVTIGDPMVYSTYIYLLKLLRDKIPVQTIAGITSFLDIASSENFPLVEGEDPLVIVPATIDSERLYRYIKEENSLVIMKVYKNFHEVIEMIRREHLEEHSMIVSNSSKEDKVVYKTFDHVKPEDISYFTTILINKGWKNQ